MRTIILSILLILSTIPSYTLNRELYPLIKKLDPSDIIFRQMTDDISSFYRNIEQNKELHPLQIYRHVITRDTTIFALAARFNFPYETITTLNRISQPQLIPAGTELLIPNTPGIFVIDIPESDIEHMSRSWRNIENAVKLVIENDRETTYYFLPGEKFHSVERAFFLGIMFRFPLPVGYISSGFGNRLHPINSKHHFHNGIDIAAPSGTDVMAARAGIIETAGYDNVRGNYISILHENGYETVYWHLKKIFVQLNQQVQSGMIIGTVGTTGMSTGPHLHFEIRNLGDPKNPSLMIPGNN